MSSQVYLIVYGEGAGSENPEFEIVGDLGEECTATIESSAKPADRHQI